MHVYNSSEHNETAVFMRLKNAMQRAKQHKRGFAVFIGAGCSLSSADHDISTGKIVERCLQDNYFKGYKAPDSWEGLYRDFVNQVWEVNGKGEQREILAEYFAELSPSIGYKNLRKLIENGYVTDIITTNFDMLIDEALSGLAYTVQIGILPPRTIKKVPIVNLYKVHGDIESGELRFSPDELNQLPDKLVSLIGDISAKSCLFCGYSGQDLGVMKSLNKYSDLVVYWSSPKKPLKNDIYGTKEIYKWLEARGSDNNFVCGDDLGKFDQLMESLADALINNKADSLNIAQWEKNTISDAIRINKQVYKIFDLLLQTSVSLRGNYDWKRSFPFYSANYETTLNAYLYYYNESSTLPSALLQIPENEIEALLMGLAIEVLVSSSGIGLSSSGYATKLREEFEKENPKYAPDDSFWKALDAILRSIADDVPLENEKDLLDIKLKLNSNGRMTLSVKEPKLRYVVDTISLLNVSGLFIPTCENDGDIDKLGQTKLLLQKHGQAVSEADNKLCFKLDKISRMDLRDIYTVFFEKLGKYHITDDRIIEGPEVKIIAALEEREEQPPVSSVSDYLYDFTANSTVTFLKLKSAFEIDSEQHITGPLDHTITEFINSDKIGMFVIGSSGSGKTKSVQNLIRTKRNDDLLIAVTSPKTKSFDSALGISVFWSDFTNHHDDNDLLQDFHKILQARNKKLLLIIEGLNEIDGGANNCIKHYRSIIETIHKITELKISTIKILVTCRDHAFLDYCEYSQMYPPIETCYSTSDNQYIVPYYQIKPLTLPSQLQFVQIYFDDSRKATLFESDLKNNTHVQQMFNQPYLIAVAGKYYSHHNAESEVVTLQEIFKFYAEQMLNRLGSYSARAIARGIINTYFELVISDMNFGRRITPYVLLNRITAGNAEEHVTILRQLCDINVFTNLHIDDYIRFTHDRIEEYFLCEFIYAEAYDKEKLLRAFKLAEIDPIFYSAASDYYKKLTQKNSFKQMLENYDFLYNQSLEKLSIIWVSCLNTLSEEKYIDLFDCAQNDLNDADTFILFLFGGLKQIIYRSDIVFPEKLITVYNDLANIFQMLSKYSKYFYYISSLYYLHQKGNMELAERYCDLSIREKTDEYYLNDLVELQKAVIMKHKTQLDIAIEKFSQLYQLFLENEKWENVAECILEWGGALREKTKFQDALIVYNMIDVRKLDNYPEYQTRLYRKKGTIYKNIMQDLLKDYFSVKDLELLEKIKHYYLNAIDELDLAKKKMTIAIDMIEKMKIVSEQAEICLKYSDIDSAQLYRAKLYLDEHDKLLAIFPVPDARVIQLRLKSKYEEKTENLPKAIRLLIEAREIALNASKHFRVFEVDYQLGRLIERNKESFNEETLRLGLKSLNQALETDLGKENKYIRNCAESKEKLVSYLSNRDIV